MAVDIRKLRHVSEVARAESITAAAQTLHITQSALTRSIAEVEAELGVELFQRLPRGVRVTEAGRTFVDRARRILGDMDELMAGLADVKTLDVGRLRVGVAPAAYQTFLTESVAALASRHPGLEVEVRTGAVTDHAPRLLGGELDLIVGPFRALEKWPELAVAHVTDFHCAMMLRRDHPLASQEVVSEKDVLAWPAVIPATMDPMLTDIAGIYAAHGLPRFKPRYQVDGFEMIRRIVAGTDAYAPIISLDPAFGSLPGEFLILRDVVDMPVQAMAVATSRSGSVTPAAQAFIDVLLDGLSARHSPRE